MNRTLLLGPLGADWTDFRGDSAIILDPDDPSVGPAGVLLWVSGSKPRKRCFIGTADASRSPHAILVALAQMLPHVEDGTIQFYGYRNTPLQRYTLQLAIDFIMPSRILIGGINSPAVRWNAPVEIVEVKVRPPIVLENQQRAQMLRMFESCHHHELHLSQFKFQNSRIGTGLDVRNEWHQAGFPEVAWVELSGLSLFVVGDNIDDFPMHRILDHFHASKLAVGDPEKYGHLLAALIRQDGETVGIGKITSINFETGLVNLLSDATDVPTDAYLRLGTLRVGDDGRKIEELTPWVV